MKLDESSIDNRCGGFLAASTCDLTTLKIKDGAREVHDNHHAALFDQYVAAGFHNDQDGGGQMTSSPDKQGHQENLALLTGSHHHG
jgi:hypothetical protein